MLTTNERPAIHTVQVSIEFLPEQLLATLIVELQWFSAANSIQT